MKIRMRLWKKTVDLCMFWQLQKERGFGLRKQARGGVSGPRHSHPTGGLSWGLLYRGIEPRVERVSPGNSSGGPWEGG
jgi:hypothetical protein